MRLLAAALLLAASPARADDALDKLASAPLLKALGVSFTADLAGRTALSFALPRAMGGKTLSFAGTWAVANAGQADQKATFATDPAARVALDDAFGLEWLDLAGAGLTLSVQGTEADVSFDATVDGKKVLVQFAEDGGGLKDFTLELPGPLKLSDLPGLKAVPGADSFTFTDPTVSRDAVFAKTTFKGETVDALAFKDSGGAWNIGLRLEKALNLGDLVGHRQGLLKEVSLPRLRLLVAGKGFSASFEDLPPAAARFFARPDGTPASGPVTVAPGINLRANFDPSASAALKKPMTALGLTGTLSIAGTVEGVFGGEPAVDLSVALPAGHATAFKFLKPHAGSTSKFFMRLSKAEEDLGVASVVELPGGKGNPPLLLEFDFGLKAKETEVEVAASGGLKGDWRNALGIPGLTLENPYLSVGVNETGGFDTLIDAWFLFGGEKVRVSADLVIEPEALFVPEAVALAGKINKIDFGQLTSHAGALTQAKHGKGLSGGGFHGLPAELTDVAFAVMTPGASLPPDLADELKMTGSGIALKGKLWVAKKQVADASGYVSDLGIGLAGDVTPFSVGPVTLKDAVLDVQAKTDAPPSLLMKGDIELFKGERARYDFEVMPDRFKLAVDTKFGGLFDLSIDAETTQGLAFTPSNDLDFDAALSADYVKSFQQLAKGAVDGLKKGAKDVSAAQASVSSAQQKVDGLNAKIADAKARAKKAFDDASRGLDSAQDKVDSLKREIDDKNDKIHDLSHDREKDLKKLKLADAAKKEGQIAALTTEVGGLYAAYGTAKGALEAAQKSVKGLPAGASPEVLALEGQLATETAGLSVAQGVLAAAKAADQGLEAAAKAVAEGSQQFSIEQVSVSGSVDGLVSAGTRGKRPVLKATCKVAGQRHVYTADVAQGEKVFARLAQRLADEAAKDLVAALTPKS